jgi:hypothetical protein
MSLLMEMHINSLVYLNLIPKASFELTEPITSDLKYKPIASDSYVSFDKSYK